MVIDGIAHLLSLCLSDALSASGLNGRHFGSKLLAMLLNSLNGAVVTTGSGLNRRADLEIILSLMAGSPTRRGKMF